MKSLPRCKWPATEFPRAKSLYVDFLSGFAMLSAFKRLLFRLAGREHLRTPQDEDAEFLLKFHEMDVGRLTLHAGKWRFEYAEAFRNREGVSPIVDFPRLEKCYESDVLWPFFLVRIPGLGQPAIRRVIQDENLDKTNEAQLLKRFGKTTIANPFTLVPADNPAESRDR